MTMLLLLLLLPLSQSMMASEGKESGATVSKPHTYEAPPSVSETILVVGSIRDGGGKKRVEVEIPENAPEVADAGARAVEAVVKADASTIIGTTAAAFSVVGLLLFQV